MALRKVVEDFIELGPLPDSSAATEEDLDRREALLRAIAAPVSDEEAVALHGSFGPDGCYGLAWSLLHLVETAPGRPRPSESTFQRSEWLRSTWTDRRGPP